jgi:EmrB/QacA subfamily drug resistance transporter
VEATGEASANRPLTLWAMVAAAGIVQLPTSAIVVALGTIHGEFNASMAELQWTFVVFYIPFTALLIAAGRLSDIFGRRRTLLLGTTVFALGSVLAAVAPGTEVLIAGIAVAGAGGAMMMPSSLAMLTNLFTGESRGVAIGLWGAATEVVSGVGILVGGVLTDQLSWRWIFWVDLIFAVIIVLMALRGTRESRDPTAPHSVDFAGVAVIAAALTCLTLALNEGSGWGWGSLPTVTLFAAGILLFASFGVVERRAKLPLIDFSFFRRRNFTGSTIVVFVLDFAFGAVYFFLPIYFEEILGYSPLQAGLLLLPMTVVMAISSPLGGRVAAKVGPRPPIVTGLAAMAIATYWLSTLTLSTDYADLWAPTAMMGFGVGFALTPMNLAAMNAISKDHAGAASGILVTLSGLGATLGVAVTGAIFQQLQTSRTVTFASDKGAQITADQARQLDGLLAGGSDATKSLHQIAGSHAAQVHEAAREAFVSALGTSLKVSTAIVLAGLILSVVLMRRMSPADAQPTVQVLPPPHPRPAPRTAAT